MRAKSNPKPWIAIVWFALWGIFQAYVVFSVVNGNWERPAAFPVEAYNAIIYPDMFFIPLYLIASILLFRGYFLGNIIGLIAGGAVIYVMIYLIALSGLKGIENLFFDSLFLAINVAALLQIMKTTLAMTRRDRN
ncbi:hypothetical protein KJ039_00620 [bacterium]|nr:hypothetical protein [bacterium]